MFQVVTDKTFRNIVKIKSFYYFQYIKYSKRQKSFTFCFIHIISKPNKLLDF